MNPSSTSFVLGFHGCSRDVAEKIISGRQSLLPSQNNYDWLGDGIYFWEFNGQRAYEFAQELRARSGKQKKSYQPAVVGAIIDLGFCLNLLDSRYIELVRQAHEDLAHKSNQAGTDLPSNSLGPDRLLRRLDCAVIRHLHWLQGHEGKQPFDTVRAAFFEGERLYENAGFAAKNHIQICVRNPMCIKGYFRPLGDDGRPLRFT